MRSDAAVLKCRHIARKRIGATGDERHFATLLSELARERKAQTRPNADQRAYGIGEAFFIECVWEWLDAQNRSAQISYWPTSCHA